MADSVSFAEVFYMAPAVAAQITLEKTYSCKYGTLQIGIKQASDCIVFDLSL